MNSTPVMFRKTCTSQLVWGYQCSIAFKYPGLQVPRISLDWQLYGFWEVLYLVMYTVRWWRLPYYGRSGEIKQRLLSIGWVPRSEIRIDYTGQRMDWHELNLDERWSRMGWSFFIFSIKENSPKGDTEKDKIKGDKQMDNSSRE